MRVVTEPAPFEALDACHRQILAHLQKLSELAQRIETVGVDAVAQQQASAIEAFFSGTARQHHEQEEKTVFAPLLAGSDPAITAAVNTLQQDHGWIEENWIELSPQLSAIASGNNWPDSAEFQHGVQVFVQLLTGHIALEETIVYPESRAQWARAVAARALRETLRPA
ncbi:MAG TPA: hemerythrin domain-containing protein [Ramlibacter sp.]|nr:hemerythrin domain-containing protein [Ramlibacter sp.]